MRCCWREDATKPKTDIIYAKLGANERALVDRVHSPLLRRIFINIIGVKLRLQFTGWLQYLIPVPFALVLLLLVGVIALVGLEDIAAVLVWLPLALFVLILFDVLTCRFGLRPPEPLPREHGDEYRF